MKSRQYKVSSENNLNIHKMKTTGIIAPRYPFILNKFVNINNNISCDSQKS